MEFSEGLSQGYKVEALFNHCTSQRWLYPVVAVGACTFGGVRTKKNCGRDFETTKTSDSSESLQLIGDVFKQRLHIFSEAE